MQEVKFNYQNFTLIPEMSDGSVNIKVINKSLFTDTASYDMVIVLEREGVRVAERTVKYSVKPGKTDTLKNVIDIPMIAGEYVVTASLLTGANYVWGRQGHEIAFG